MIMLLPLKKFNPNLYYRIEGKIFHWLLATVAMWSSMAGYEGKFKLKKKTNYDSTNKI
jgi:lysophosphatidylglycerol acyltransferase 1